MKSLTNLKKRDAGFTLLELLIVIAIIAILSIALVFMLNPAETLKKARDAQRISDLKTVKTALGIMLTASSTPRLDSTTGLICTTTTAGAVQGTSKIAYSASSTAPTTSTTGGSDTIGAVAFTTPGYTVSAASAGKVDGTGWIPVNLKALTGGTPISSFPVDPINTLSSTAASTDLVYRYACQNGTPTASPTKPAYIFEIDAVLESNAYTVEDNKMSKDGGDNIYYYESGNSLNLLPGSDVTTF